MTLLLERYAGCVCNRQAGFSLVFARNSSTNHYEQYFSNKTHTLEDVECIRRRISDDCGLTLRFFVSTAEESLRRYLIGFAEGDGCITVERTGRLHVLVTQVQANGVPDILKQFVKTYGGSIKSSKRTHETWRTKFEWHCCGFRCLPILHDWVNFGTLKRDQASIVYNHLMTEQDTNCSALYETMHAMKLPAHYLNVDIDDAVVTTAYIAGLFDAEGTIGSYKGSTSIKVAFAQKNSLMLLDSINNFFDNMGRVDDKHGRLTFIGEKADSVLRYLLGFLQGKKPQAIIALQIRAYKCIDRYTGRDHATNMQILSLQSQLKKIKRI